MKTFDLDKLKYEQDTTDREALLKNLSHPYIVKFYKQFKKDKEIGIIFEYVPNGDLNKFIGPESNMREEVIWNLLLQCFEALVYIHSNHIIHRDIKPSNILIDNNMRIKLGDFGISALVVDQDNSKNINKKIIFKGTKYRGTPCFMAPEVFYNNENYDYKVDVYSMGISFFQMCFPKDKKDDINRILKESKKYSPNLLNIIQLMTMENKNERKTSMEILDIIRKKYPQEYIKNTSINSILRCLYALTPLRMYYIFKKIENKPITEAFIQCFRYIKLNGLNSDIPPISFSTNSNLEGTKEADPRYILAFLINEINKESNDFIELKQDKNKFLINEDLDKEQMMIKFVKKTSNKIKSYISKSFSGLMKITMNCNKCNLRTFKYINFFYITFNIENMLEENGNIKDIDIKKNLYLQTDKIDETLYCKKCLNKTQHYCYKCFESFPFFLIISIKRNIFSEKDYKITIVETLNMEPNDDYQREKFNKGTCFSKNCQKQYSLVGFIGRNKKDNNESYFSVTKSGNKWILYEKIKLLKSKIYQIMTQKI